MASTKKKGRKQSPKLTPQQDKFATHYALHGNGAEAYAHAYPASRKHTPQYRSEKASRLLAEGKMRDKVSSLSAKVAEVLEKKFEITAEKVLSEIAAIAFAQPGDYFKWGRKTLKRTNKDGTEYEFEADFVDLTPSDQLTDVQKKAVAAVEMTTNKFGDTYPTLKMQDKRAALRDLGQHLKLFTTGIDVGGKGGGPVQIVISSAEDGL